MNINKDVFAFACLWMWVWCISALMSHIHYSAEPTTLLSSPHAGVGRRLTSYGTHITSSHTHVSNPSQYVWHTPLNILHSGCLLTPFRSTLPLQLQGVRLASLPPSTLSLGPTLSSSPHAQPPASIRGPVSTPRPPPHFTPGDAAPLSSGVNFPGHSEAALHLSLPNAIASTNTSQSSHHSALPPPGMTQYALSSRDNPFCLGTVDIAALGPGDCLFTSLYLFFCLSLSLFSCYPLFGTVYLLLFSSYCLCSIAF